MAGGVRRGGANGVAVFIQQGHSDASDAGFAGILHTVLIGIIPDEIADAAQRIQVACIPGEIVLSDGQRDQRRAAIRGAWVAVFRVATLIGGDKAAACAKAGWELQIVVGGIKASEAVEAGGVRGGGADGGAAAVEQVDGHALDAGFARVLHAIGVQITPHIVADAGLRCIVARVHTRDVAGRSDGDRAGATGGDERIAVRFRVAALVRIRQHGAIGQ